MSFVKSSLKAAKDEILAGNFTSALEYCNDVLEEDPSNFNALLFKGKALGALQNIIEADKAFRKAASIKSNDPLPWKGLISMYQDTTDYRSYIKCLVGLIKCFEPSNDVISALNAFITAQKHFMTKYTKTPAAMIAFLELELPGSPIYDFLMSHMPALDLTLEKLIEYKTKLENPFSKNNVAVNITNRYEAIKKSTLPSLYEQLADVTESDKLRLSCEENLIRFYLELLKLSTDPAEKESYRDKLVDRISTIILVKIDAEEGWRLGLDWQDAPSLSALPTEEVYYYSEKFKRQGFAKVLKAFLHSKFSSSTSRPSAEGRYDGVNVDEEDYYDDDDDENENENESSNEKSTSPPTNNEKESAKTGKVAKPSKKSKSTSISLPDHFALWSDSVILDYISEGFDIKSAPILAYRIVGEFYLSNQEYETAADVVQAGLKQVKEVETLYKVLLPHSKTHLSLILAQCYTYYQAPKNYDLALKLFRWVLQQVPNSVEARLGEGTICRERGESEKARELLQEVVNSHPENTKALYELALCYITDAQYETACDMLESCLSKVSGTDLLSLELRSSIMWRLGETFWLLRSKDTAYTNTCVNWYIRLLKENPSYAPAYTSMGRYYDEVTKDSARAMKCYYKAFELDSGELDAAKKLATDFADQGDWEMAEVIASRVVSSDKLRTSTTSSTSKDVQNWPHRVLGVAALNKNDIAKAVSYFQVSLRLSSQDIGSWMGLGEAYVKSGRYSAGVKAFERAVSLDGTKWVAKVQLALIKRDIFQFSGAIEILQSVLDLDPDNIRPLLLETLLLSAKFYMQKDYFGLAIENAVSMISVAMELVLNSGISTQNIWRCIADCCLIFLGVLSRIDQVPFESLYDLLSSGCAEHGVPVPERFDEKVINGRYKLVEYMIIAANISYKNSSSKRASKALAAYNFGVAYYIAFGNMHHSHKQRQKYLSESVKFFKEAIRLESRNYTFWNAYGIAVSFINARVAQHCFIRALKFNDQDPMVWNNLATLYLNQSDSKLAQMAFEKALSIDPDISSSWVGLGIIESTSGKSTEAHRHFEHSLLISKGQDLAPKLCFSLSVLFNAMMKSASYNSMHDVGRAILALEHFLKVCPDVNETVLLQSFMYERNGNFESAAGLLSRQCDALEAKFEKDDDPDDVFLFTVCKSQLARMFLASRQFEKALESAETTISFIASDDDDSSAGSLSQHHKEVYKSCHLSAVLTAGLSHFFLKQFPEAIECFKDALEISSEETDVVVLLVQVLWAQGGDEEREIAIEQLYAKIDGTGATPSKITILLGVIGLLGNTDVVEAAHEELKGLSLYELLNDVDYAIPDVVSNIEGTKDSWYTMAFYRPSSYTVWKNIDTKMALEVATHYGNVRPEELSTAYSDAGLSLQNQQLSAFICPWKLEPWNKMAKILAESA